MADYADRLRERLPAHEIALARTPAAERDRIGDARVVTGMNVDEDLLAHADAIEAFACIYAGTDHVPLDAFEARDIAVTNASGVHGPNIAEHVLAVLLAHIRRLRDGWRRQERREWRHYQADELAGSTVTVVGLGAIGRTVCERLDAFDVDTIGVRYTPSKSGPADEVIGFEDGPLHDALARTDHLVLSCPLTDTTRGLIGHEELITLPASATLVNVARGPVVDTDALVAALRRNRIDAAALDVTDPEPLPEEHPLWRFENVTITPHNAGHTPAYFDRLADIVAGNVERLDAGDRDLENRVV
jgi:phosphoglycerate dehydrogenase-like enzyme